MTKMELHWEVNYLHKELGNQPQPTNGEKLLLTETAYFDFEQNKLISGADGELTIDLSEKKFNYNGWSTIELEFKMPEYVEPELPQEEINIPSSGTITNDNRALLILLNYDKEAISLTGGEITFVAVRPDGSELAEEEDESITWTAEILQKGQNINSFTSDIQYYFVGGNSILWDKESPLPSAAKYQIYVTASWTVDEAAPAVTMSNSHIQ